MSSQEARETMSLFFLDHGKLPLSYFSFFLSPRQKFPISSREVRATLQLHQLGHSEVLLLRLKLHESHFPSIATRKQDYIA